VAAAMAALPGGKEQVGEAVGVGRWVMEHDLYAALLGALVLLDRAEFGEMAAVCKAAIGAVSEGAMRKRTVSVILSRIFFYYSLAHERLGSLESIRGYLVELLQTSTLALDEYGQEVLLNLILRNFISFKLYDQAEKFRSKVQRPPSRSNAQQCRYLYYLGRIRAIQLEYAQAKECLVQAMRKAPSKQGAAQGFRVELQKWTCVVCLLLGEIPERKSFRQPGLREPLEPYFALTQAVWAGDLTAFNAALAAHGDVFAADETLNLIVRLRSNVIRTGLRRINLSYSRISLGDVAARLGLDSTEQAELVVAKAIRDGGINARIDQDAGAVVSKDAVDVYVSGEPQVAFHSRIAFCLDLHNDIVRSMRFPQALNQKKTSESDEERREREQAEAMLAEQIADMEDDF